MSPDVLQRDSVGTTPAEIILPDGTSLSIESATATFDGTSAASSFYPCLSLYSQAGFLIGRYFPQQMISPGDSAHVTFAPTLSGDSPQRSEPYHLISAGSTNAGTVKTTAGVLNGYYIVNTALAFRYVKLYNKASSPTVGTDVPTVVLGIPAASAANISLDEPLSFTTGIAIATTTGIADSDSTAVGANELAVTLYFR